MKNYCTLTAENSLEVWAIWAVSREVWRGLKHRNLKNSCYLKTFSFSLYKLGHVLVWEKKYIGKILTLLAQILELFWYISGKERLSIFRVQLIGQKRVKVKQSEEFTSFNTIVLLFFPNQCSREKTLKSFSIPSKIL